MFYVIMFYHLCLLFLAFSITCLILVIEPSTENSLSLSCVTNISFFEEHLYVGHVAKDREDDKASNEASERVD